MYCKDCKYWGKYDELQTAAQCSHPKLYNINNAYIRDMNDTQNYFFGEPPFYTEPLFGCIHFEEK